MTKIKKIAAMTAALLICAGNMGYMPESTKSISGFTANAADAAAESVEISETNFPDGIFRKYVADNFDKDNDGVLSPEEIAKATYISVANSGISDLTGIDKLTNLKTLDCNNNNLINLDISNNTALSTLFCEYTQLTSLNTSNNTSLKKLYCSHSNLETLDVSNNTELVDLYCDYNQLKTLDVSNNTKLEYLSCEKNQFTSLDVSNNTALKYFACDTNQLTTLDISKNTALEFFDCNTNFLTSIDLSNNPLLYSSNGCILNKYEIALANNTFDLSTLPTGFDVTKASDWTNATVEGNILTVEDASREVTYKYDCGNEQTATFTLIPQIAETQITSVEISETNFPDAVFRQYVADNFDKDDDSVLSAEEIEAVTEIDVNKMKISSLIGVEYFTELTSLSCDNNQIAKLNISNNKNLSKLYCDNNLLTAIDLTNNTELTYISCYKNQIKELDLSNNTKLTNLNCDNNQLTKLDLSKNIELTYLTCVANQLTSINVSKNNLLSTFDCSLNKYNITAANDTFNLLNLPKDFDTSKAFDWSNGTVTGDILTIEDTSREVTYKYDCGNSRFETFKLLITFSTGDVNNNGSIDSSDATLILSDYSVIATGGTSSFSAEQAKAADINNDGKYDSIDASLILAYYAHTSTGGAGTIEEYLSKANAEEQLKALREKKESEVQLFAAAYIGFTDDMNEVDAVEWIKENSPVFCKNYSFVKDIPAGQIAGTPMGELYCIVPFDENSTVAINRIVQDENGSGSYENVIYRSESGEPILFFCNNIGANGDAQVTVTDSDGNKVVWFPSLDEKLMLNCPYNANYDTYVYDFSQYQEILEKEHTTLKNFGWKLPTAADLRFTNWSGIDYRGMEVIGSYKIEFGEDTAYIKWVDDDEEHEFKDVEWQLEFVDDTAVVTFNFNEFAGILQYNFLLNENYGKLYTAVNYTNEDTLDENVKLYRTLSRYEYSEPIS